MKRTLFALLLAGAAFCMLPVQAQAPASAPDSGPAAAPAKKPVPKKTVKKKPAQKSAAPAVAVADEDEKEPDIAGTTVIDYQCELGNKLTIFQNIGDNQHIALKWGSRLHRMARVDTSTGANRFENRRYGLVWIGIPAKGILLNSITGHQLANECKTAEQRAPNTIGILKAAVEPRV